MSFAAIAAMGVLFVVTKLIMPEATTLSNISAVLVIGLIGDILSTWLMNLGILKTYIDWRQSKKQDKYNISPSATNSKSSDNSKDESDETSDKKSKLSFKDKLKKKTEVEDDEIMSKIEEELEKIDNMEKSSEDTVAKSSKSNKNKKSNKKVNKRKAKKQKGKGGK
jgi:preprotein translocase subunit SecF